MGQAKHKRLGSCRCQSGKAAETCCLTDHGWHKHPEVVRVKNTGEVGRHESCYLKGANSCCSKISGEHLISEAVLRILAEQELEISGYPWLKGGKKRLRFKNLTANCLCKTHNSALSSLDAAGGRFFEAIQKCGTGDIGPTHNFLISGHDLERWMLKTLGALVASKNFAIDGDRLDGKFVERLGFLELLEDATNWKQPLGLYMLQGIGHRFTRRDNFELAPLILRGSDDVVGIWMDIQGLHVGLLATEQDIAGTGFDRSVYRPGRYIFQMAHLTHTIQLSWNDKLPHIDLTMTWQP
jgi:hypothetical protein